MRVDLNADVGESFGAFVVGCDAGLLRAVTSVSVAAGFHGGDPSVLRATLRAAGHAGVSVGAHPGFPDLAGFGRRDMTIPSAELEDLVLYQIAAVAGVAAAEGVRLRHVKPHGALYNMAARDRTLAGAVVGAMTALDRSLCLYCPAGSALEERALDAGVVVVAEAFADRAYHADGRLVGRHVAGAVLAEPRAVVARAIRLLQTGEILSVEGRPVKLRVDTLCVHGDTPGADQLAADLRAGFERAGVEVAAPR